MTIGTTNSDKPEELAGNMNELKTQNFSKETIDDNFASLLQQKAVSNINQEFTKNSTKTSLNLNSLAFSCGIIPRGPYEAEIEESIGMDFAGYAVTDINGERIGKYSRISKFYDYFCCLLIDGTVFEAFTPRDQTNTTYILHNASVIGKCICNWDNYKSNKFRTDWKLYMGDSLYGTVSRGTYFLFDRFFYIKSMVKCNSLKIKRAKGQDLPIYLARNDTPLDFLMFLIKLITLYPIWGPKKWLRNKDLIIPQGASGLQSEEEKTFYFVVNLIFRMLFFDIAFADNTTG